MNQSIIYLPFLRMILEVYHRFNYTWQVPKANPVGLCWERPYTIVALIYLSDFVKTWPLGFRLVPDEAQVQASPASKIVGGLASWSVQLHSPGTALTAGGWIRPGGQN